jgi:hypothetical protein
MTIGLDENRGHDIFNPQGETAISSMTQNNA